MRSIIALNPLMAALCLVALQAGPAAAQAPDPGANWILVEEKPVSYGLAGSLVTVSTETKHVSTRAVATATEERGRATRRSVKERDEAATRSSDANRDEAGPKTRSQRDEGRYRNRYDNWQVDTIKTTTRVTPYRLYDITDWEDRTRTTWAKTFKDTTTYTWADALSNAPIAVVKTSDPPVVQEITYSEWGPKQAKTVVGGGNDVATSSVVIKTVQKSVLVGRAPADAAGAGEADVAAGASISSSGDAGKGAAGARSASAGASMRMAGSSRVKAQGGTASGLGDMGSLLDAARSGPDLYGSKGVKAWKLGARGKSVLLSPYDSAGKVGSGIVLSTLGEGSAGGSSPGLGRVVLRAFAIRSGAVTLSGQFQNDLLPESSQVLVTR